MIDSIVTVTTNNIGLHLRADDRVISPVCKPCTAQTLATRASPSGPSRKVRHVTSHGKRTSVTFYEKPAPDILGIEKLRQTIETRVS